MASPLDGLEGMRREQLARLRGELTQAAREQAQARAAQATAAARLVAVEHEVALVREEFGRATTVRALQRAAQCLRALQQQNALLDAEHRRLVDRMHSATATLRAAEDAVRAAGIDVRVVERAIERRARAVSRRTEERAEDELDAAFRARTPR